MNLKIRDKVNILKLIRDYYEQVRQLDVPSRSRIVSTRHMLETALGIKSPHAYSVLKHLYEEGMIEISEFSRRDSHHFHVVYAPTVYAERFVFENEFSMSDFVNGITKN